MPLVAQIVGLWGAVAGQNPCIEHREAAALVLEFSLFEDLAFCNLLHEVGGSLAISLEIGAVRHPDAGRKDLLRRVVYKNERFPKAKKRLAAASTRSNAHAPSIPLMDHISLVDEVLVLQRFAHARVFGKRVVAA